MEYGIVTFKIVWGQKQEITEVQESTQTFSLIEKLLTARQYFCGSDNKSKLLRLLSTQLLSWAPNNKTFAATDNKMVVSNHDIYLNNIWLVTQKR